MPRKLPWMSNGGSSSTATRPNKPSTAITQLGKRARLDKSESEDASEEIYESSRDNARTRPNSSSTPQETPSEQFMNEGLDGDDKYRMVEDEFLTIAQKMTVHLHTAELKRQKKMVKARNAEAINSITRTVTERMPDHTRRRVESLAKAKTQRNAIKDFLKTKAAAEDTESDEDGLPYIGTSLHGLMDSPGKRAASLSKIGLINATTRAAAGFQKPAETKTVSPSPLSKTSHIPARPCKENDLCTASEDEDDDLDAPTPASKSQILERVRACTAETISSSHPTPASSAGRTSGSNERPTVVKSAIPVKNARLEPDITSFEPLRALSDLSERRAKRLERTRIAKEEREKEERKKKLDIIPTF